MQSDKPSSVRPLAVMVCPLFFRYGDEHTLSGGSIRVFRDLVACFVEWGFDVVAIPVK